MADLDPLDRLDLLADLADDLRVDDPEALLRRARELSAAGQGGLRLRDLIGRAQHQLDCADGWPGLPRPGRWDASMRDLREAVEAAEAELAQAEALEAGA